MKSKPASRRNVLSMLALAAPAVVAGAVPALAGINLAAGREAVVRAHPTVKADIDPIFAAIEKHRAAYAAFCAAVEAEGVLDEELPYERKRSNYCAGEATIVETDDPRWIEAQHATNATLDAAEGAALDLLEVRATTVAGAAALLAYAAEHVRQGYGWPQDLVDDDHKNRRDWEVYLHEAVADSLKEIDRLQPAA